MDRPHTGGGPGRPLGRNLSIKYNDSISLRFRRLGLKIVREALAKTTTREDAARRLGVPLKTFYRWLEWHPELAEAPQAIVTIEVRPTGTDGDD
jgi:DNA invertase Pin-like site-specific DNA recombinase